MIKAYAEKRDLYSVIASMSFGASYEDCLEFYPEGTKVIQDGKEVIAGYKNIQNPEGKARRTMAKSILLGILYGRGAASVGEQIGKSKEEAQEIIDKFFKAFPSVKNWINESIESAHKNGYVTDVAGRRRRLPDAQLPKYAIKFTAAGEKANGSFNPFLGCVDRVDESSNSLLKKYQQKCDKIKYAKEYEKIQAEALQEGVEIHSNTGFIAQAERQAVNSRVQGGAATLTKSALIKIHRDDRLKNINAYLVNTVHDEILLETPAFYGEQAQEYLIDDMLSSAKEFVTNVDMAADGYLTWSWYLDEYQANIQKDFKKLLEKRIQPLEAFEQMCIKYDESTRDQLYELVAGFLPEIPHDVKLIKTLS